jgi:SnoaL-like domain
MSDGTALVRLVDRAALEDLATTYMRGLDRRDRDLLRSVFHDDATTHYGAFSGDPDSFVAYAMRALSSHEINQHLIGQVGLWWDSADTARGEIYFQAFHRLSRDGTRVDMTISGRYVDRYERRDGTWRMSHRTEIVDWARTEPTSDDYLPTHPLVVLGRPDRSDLSYRINEA